MAEYRVSKGETSTGLTLSFDSMFVLKGGTAEQTTVQSPGSMYISKGGMANDTTVDGTGSVFLCGSASRATLVNNGCMCVSKGGVLTNAAASSSGRLVVSKGGTVNSATFISSGALSLYGGTVNSAMFNSRGSAYVYGGTLNSAMVNSRGVVYVSKGGAVNSSLVNSGGSIYLSSGAKANNAVISGYMCVSGATANNITVEQGGRMAFYYSGTKGSGLTVGSGASVYIGSGTVVNNVALAGNLEVDDGGTAKGIRIDSGASFSLDGTATKITWTPGNGIVKFAPGCSATFTSKYSGVYVGSARAFVSQTTELLSATLAGDQSAYVAKGGRAQSLVLKDGATMQVWNGGAANSIGIGADSWMDVSSGAALDCTSVSSDGFMYIIGGKASNTVISSGGEVQINNGGSASRVRIESGGTLYISSGTATDVDWTPFNGSMHVGQDAQVTFADSVEGGVYVGANGELTSHADTVKDLTLGQLDMGIKYSVTEEMYVMSGGKAENTAVGNYGSMYVFGGTAEGTTIANGGSAAIYGGTMRNTTLGYEGGLYAEKGGSAVGVTVSSGAWMYVMNGGFLDDATVCSGVYRNAGCVYVSSGAVVTNIALEYGTNLYVEKGAKVTNIRSSYGSYISTEKGASVKKITAVAATSPDCDYDEKNGWENKKKKIINSYVVNSKATVLNGDSWGDPIKFDETDMTYEAYDNYVGYQDEIDFKKVHLDSDATLCFDLYATDASKFTIWRWDTKGKGKLVSLQSTALKKYESVMEKKSSSSSIYYYAETKGVKLAAGDYYLSVESTNAAKGGNAYYTVYMGYNSQFYDEINYKDGLDDDALTLPDAAGTGSLDIPENGTAFAGGDVLNLQEDLNFGQYAADTLADVSAAAGLDAGPETAWRNIALA